MSEAAFRIHTVAVIGAGVAGREFALASAAAGFDVVVEDVMPAKLRRAQELYADLRTVAGVGAGAGRLEVALTVEDAVRTADIAVDFVPDELESKLEIFSMVDRMAPPKTILLTPSEVLSITDLASCTYRGDRCFSMRGDWIGRGDGEARVLRLLYPVGLRGGTDGEALEATEAFLRTLGVGVNVEADSESPVLMKNQAGSVRRLDECR